MAHRVLQAVAISLAATSCVATQFITEDTLPIGTFSDKCAGALTANISCEYQVSRFTQETYWPVDFLEACCDATCANGLAAYEKGVSAACGKDDVYKSSETSMAPASRLPLIYRYSYNKTCIQDGDRWCNNVAGKWADGTVEEDRCDNCAIKIWQFVAGSSMYGGPAMRPSYTALTKSCSKTGFPLAPATSVSTGIPSSSAGATPTASSCAGGKTYTIKPGDTCQSISESQGIGTAQLLQDNNLSAYCSDFPKAGNLCIKSTCSTYVVGANDTCKAIGRQFLITQVQLTTWNPILGDSCRYISRQVGNSICVSPAGEAGDHWTPITIPASTTTATTSATPAPVPTNLANGTVERCGQYYTVEQGDYCNKIILKYGIDLEDFLFLNQGLNANCTNLYANETYCVAPVGSIDQYPGAPGYITPGESYSNVPYTDYPKATYTPPSNNGTSSAPLPIAPGSREDCYAYSPGTDLQIDVSGTFYTSACELVAEEWGKTLEQLTTWNPSLDANGTCVFSRMYRYCMDPYKPVATPTTTTGPTSPPGSSSAPGSTPPSTPTSGSTSVATSTTATTTTSGGAPGPTQSGIPDNCNKWHLVESKDETCYDVAQDAGITLDQFYKWNPAIKNDCAEGFWKGNAYCVGVAA